MSCIISIADDQENVWIIQNEIFRWFLKIAKTKYHFTDEIVHQLELAMVFNGLNLDVLYRENPMLAIRLRNAILQIAIDISSGKFTLTDDGGRRRPEMQEKCERSFRRLVQLLTDWHPD